MIRLLGEELISDEVMAVAELVKNAYDADASTVTISLNHLHDLELACLEIIDDGTGMSLETLLDTWLEPATPHKRNGGRKRRTVRGRYPLGEKGVGRFAADKLGADLELVTRENSSSDEVRITVSWDDFADGDYLDEIGNAWEVRAPVEFTGNSHGTLLRIRRLRVPWNRALVERVWEGLARLVSPTARSGDFSMHLECSAYSEFSGPVETRLLAAASYRLVGYIDGEGLLQDGAGGGSGTDLRVRAGEHFWMAGGRLREPVCGPFSISLSVWDLDVLGRGGMRLNRSLRALLRRTSGVSIYRDGFRVAPYGQSGDDWLELNHRRVNNPTMRVSTNQIVGMVEITQEANGALRDRTSREGLIENDAYRDLKALTIAALSRLEEERYARRKADTLPVAPPGADPVLAQLEHARTHGGGTMALQAAATAYKRYREGMERREQALLRLASTGAAAKSLLGQLNGSVASLMSLLPFLRSRPSDLPQMEQLERYLRVTSGQLDALERLYAAHVPLPSRFDLRALAQDALTIYSPLFSTSSIRASVQGSAGVSANGDRGAVLQALLLVLENSILGAMGQPEDRWIEISVAPDPGRLVTRDSGPGVDPRQRENVFDPFFTGHEGHDGLGLFFARSLLRSSGQDLTFSEDGAHFQIVFTGG